MNHSTYDLLTDYRLWINEFQEFYNEEALPASGAETLSRITLSTWMILVYISGVVFFTVRTVRQLYGLAILNGPSINNSGGKFKIILTDNFNAPFSFFNHIFMPAGYTRSFGNDSVVKHEMVHSEQLHSLDLVLSEIYCIVFWFNPFAFLLKQSLKTVHEYIADSVVIRHGYTTTEYLDILVATTELSGLSGIINHFKSITIKKRIEMITKNKTSKIKSINYLLLLPVVLFIIQAFAVQVPDNDPPKIRPVKGGEITLEFGFKGKHPITKKEFIHGGVDIKAPQGTEVVSAASGRVIEAIAKEDWGNLVIIKHDDVFETWYAHLKDFSVKKGDRVSAGQMIGHVGNTGYSTGPHLHYEVRKNGTRVNPVEYFE